MSLPIEADIAASIQFDHIPRTRLVFGPDTIERVGELAIHYGAKRVLLVTDPGIVQAGHAARVETLLEESGLFVVPFFQARENPTTECVDDCVRVAKAHDIDFIIGLGGGSSMDTAKGCNFILTNGGRMQDYWGFGKATRPMLPLIAIPTTAGTGSECQSFTLIADAETHQKMACGDPKASALVAILDPSLTCSQPVKVTACTGIDAIAHAVETAVTKKRNPLSLMYSREAFRLAVKHFPVVMRDAQDKEARGGMLLAAAFAGTAIENSMLGAAHSMANPLTAHYGIVHGKAVGISLPWVVEFNRLDPGARDAYAELAYAAAIVDPSKGPDSAVDALIETLRQLLDQAGMDCRFADCGVKESMIPTLAEEASKQWTAGFNPRPITKEDFALLFQQG